MATFSKAVSGEVVLGADLANNAALASIAIPAKSAFADWAAVDITTLAVSVNGTETYFYPAVELIVAATLTITNKSGVTWLKGSRLNVSAKQRELKTVTLTQANYDLLATKDANTIYLAV